MNNTGTVILKKGKEGSFLRFHPWIFSGAIASIDERVQEGDWVRIADSGKKILGYGHFQKGSIAIRILSFDPRVDLENFWELRLSSAYSLRQAVGVMGPFTNAFRMVHGEGDGLPGLIIDIYNGVAVMQAHSIGMHRDRQAIVSALQAVLDNSLSAVYYKSHSTLPGGATNEYLLGMAPVPHTILEHGNKFFVDWEEGQKTGFFLDQRENRKLLESLSKGKTVLNTFCYTGGFSVYALSAGARLVHSVDASEKAVELTRKNIDLNGFDPQLHKCFAADTFDFFRESNEKYDLIILDPPAFAKHKDARHQAMKGYQRLNAEAIRRIQPGGIIFTFSCSQVVDRQLFYDTVVSSAIQAGRDVKVLHHLSQPADHPVSIYHPEGEYLKGLVLYVN